MWYTEGGRKGGGEVRAVRKGKMGGDVPSTADDVPPAIADAREIMDAMVWACTLEYNPCGFQDRWRCLHSMRLLKNPCPEECVLTCDCGCHDAQK